MLFLFVVQDVTHIDAGYRPRARVNVLGDGLSVAGFQVIITGRFWVFTEVPAKRPIKTVYIKQFVALIDAAGGTEKNEGKDESKS